MNYDIKQALDEIKSIPPLFRRDVIVSILRENLSENDAREIIFNKTKPSFMKKMMAEGLISREELLERIGKERILQFFHIISNKA